MDDVDVLITEETRPRNVVVAVDVIINAIASGNVVPVRNVIYGVQGLIAPCIRMQVEGYIVLYVVIRHTMEAEVDVNVNEMLTSVRCFKMVPDAQGTDIVSLVLQGLEGRVEGEVVTEPDEDVTV